ncbi:endonuclease [Acholeplasma laidlawii]|uniref:endonuclease n=1 Tax=Acholeplasma laidlawii TaxID=2148 RepID=UPI0021F7813B|nr:endonuclease [Acholeplasma laidlawii]
MEEIVIKRIVLLLTLLFSSLSLASCLTTTDPLTVTFEVNNEVYETLEVNSGEVLTLPNDPSVTNYEFNGWFFDPLFTDPFSNESYEVTYSFTLYAKMRELDLEDVYFLVTFYDDQTELASLLVKVNTIIPNTVDTSKEGFYFAGWYTDQSLTTPYNSQTPVVSELALYGKWNEQTDEYLAYYSGIEGLSGSTLKNKLAEIIKTGYKSIGYSSTSYIIEDSDKITPQANTLWLIYNSGSANAKWDKAQTWNKEHVWPRAILPNSTAESDIHNLRASNVQVNNSRGSMPFRTSSGSYKSIGGGWYPGDEHIGDVARIVIYMHLRRNIAITSSSIDDLSMFLAWHLEDPVSDFERNRNEVIYQNQKNRNPFIDHPELVSMVFGNQSVSNQVIEEKTTLGLPTTLSFILPSVDYRVQ